MKWNRNRIVGASSLLAMVTSLTAPTYWAGYKLNNADALGGLKLLGFSLYYPGQAFEWAANFGKVYPYTLGLSTAAMVVGFAASAFAGSLLRKNQQEKPPEFGASHYATLDDAEKAGLLSGEGVVIGKLDGVILTHNSPGHLAVAGGSRSGKGRGLNIPTLLNVVTSTFTFDPKGEFMFGDEGVKVLDKPFEGVSGWRSKFSHVVYWNPLDRRSARWNPFFEVTPRTEVRDAMAMAIIMSDPNGTIENPDIWVRDTRSFYAGLFLHQLYALPDKMKNFGGTRDLLGGNLEELAWKMQHTNHLGDRPHPAIARAARVLFVRAKESPKFISSIVSTADSFLGLWDDPDIRFSTETSDFRLSSLMCAANPVSMFAVIPASDEEFLMPLQRLMIRQFLRAHMLNLRRDAQGNKKLHKLLGVFDEFPTLGKMDFFIRAIRRMAGYDIKAFMTMQSSKDFASVYGEKNPFLDIIEGLIAFAATDPDAQNNIGQMVGAATEYRRMENESGDKLSFMLDKRSVVNSEVQRQVLDSGAVRALDASKELILIPGFKPFLVDKVKYDQDPVFQERCLPAAPVGDGNGNYPDRPEPDWKSEWLGKQNDECPPMPEKEDQTKPPKDKTDKAKKVKDELRAIRRAKPEEDLPPPPDWGEEPESPSQAVPLFELEREVYKPTRRKRTFTKAETP